MTTISSLANGPAYQPPKVAQVTQPQPLDPAKTVARVAATDSDGDSDGSRTVDLRA